MCPECGSTSRVGRGLCLTCLLYQGLDADTCNDETLEAELAGINVREADWRLGNYQILEEIGRGGMGVIYRARQRHSRRIVAVKRILSLSRRFAGDAGRVSAVKRKPQRGLIIQTFCRFTKSARTRTVFRPSA